MSLSEAIKNTRQMALLSQEDFAKELHVSVGSINRWENGKTIPNITAMKSLKAFCEEQNLPYETIQMEWIKEKE